MALKFKLDPDPTFKKKVDIPVPGKKPEPVEFTFKFRPREEFLEFVEKAVDMDNADLVMEVCSGWELAEPFDRDHVAKLDKNYMGAARAIYDAYLRENGQARLGN